jgi:hypothetical protein
MILHRMSVTGLSGFFDSSYGWAITTGGILGTFMWANVWFVIWPNQKVVIASAVQVVNGGQAIPDAAARGRRGFLASRTNFIFSIPMLFFRGGEPSFPLRGTTAGAKAGMALIRILLLLAIEANALTGATGPAKKAAETVPQRHHIGPILTAVFVLLFALCSRTLARSGNLRRRDRDVVLMRQDVRIAKAAARRGGTSGAIQRLSSPGVSLRFCARTSTEGLGPPLPP